MSGSGWSLVGQSGSMPLQTYFRKVEETPMWEDPEALNQNRRQVLKQTGTQAPFFASDEKRDNNGTMNYLNLHYSGSKVPDDPYLKDGQFLDWEFAYRDNRAANINEPNMQDHVKQQWARRDLVLKYPDADFGIPEHGVAPAQAVQNVQAAYMAAGKYLNIFEDSLVGFHNGAGMRGPAEVTGGKVLTQTRFDQEFGDPLGFDLQTRRSYVTKISNETPIGWRSTTDHDFKISKYRENPSVVLKLDPRAMRGSVVKTHEDSVRVDDHLIPVSTAGLIVDLTRRKQDMIASGQMPYFEESVEAMTKKQKIATDISGIQRSVAETQPETAHSRLDMLGTPKTGQKPGRIDNSLAIASPVFVEQVLSQVRKTPGPKQDTHQTKNRDKTIIGVVEPLVVGTGENKKLNPKNDVAKILRSTYTTTTTDEKKIISFKGIKPQRPVMYGKAAFDHPWSTIYDKQSGNKKIKREIGHVDKNTTSNDGQDFGLDRVQTKLVGPLGSKYTNHHLMTDHARSEMADI